MTVTVPVKVKEVSHNKGTTIIPTYANSGDACFDLYAHLEGHEDDYEAGVGLVIKPGERVAVPTGLAFEIPVGYRMDIYARSGNARTWGIDLANSVGKIDSGYRGEVKVLLRNDGADPFYVRDGDRIAQAEINPVFTAQFELVDELADSERGAGGFGSSGR